MEYPIYLVFLIFHQFFQTPPTCATKQGTKYVPCPLQWREVYRGCPIPPGSVTTSLKSNSCGSLECKYLGRVKAPQGYTIIEIDSNFTVIESLAEIFGNEDIEILINPLNCTMKWMSIEESRVPVKYLVKNGKEAYIGAIKTQSNEYAPCNLIFGSKTICRSLFPMDSISWSDTFLLKSYIKPVLQIELDHLEILNQTTQNHITNNNANCEKLSNKGDADVSKILTLSTESSQKFRIALGAGINLGVDGQIEVEGAVTAFSVKLFYGSVSLHLGLDLSLNIGGDYSQEAKTTVLTTQMITLPAKTAIEACSQVEERNVKIYFEAEAKIWHSFLRGEDLLGIIENDDRFAGPFELDSDTIRVKRVEGYAMVTQPLNSEVVIAPLNYFEARSLN